jgi:toxin FitB
MYLIDTNIVSALRRRPAPIADQPAHTWASTVQPNDLYISVITLMEIEHGILQLARKDTRQASVLRQWLEQRVKPAFEGRILVIDEAAALHCAALHSPNPKPERDAWIAATAIAHSLTVVSRNAKDFQQMNVGLVNPWGI